jgi:hypothetical protein
MTTTRPHAVPPYDRPHETSGWVEATGFIVSVSLLSIIFAYGARIGVHPIAFIFDSMLLSAIGILTIVGPGPHWRRTIRMPQSWLLGTATILTEVFFYLLLTNVQPALGSTLIRVTVLATMLVGFWMFNRTPRPLQMLGGAIIALAVVALFQSVPADHLMPTSLAVLGCVVMLTTRAFAAEFHPDNRAAKTVLEKIRITGLVVLVTSIAGLVGLSIGSALVASGTIGPGLVVPTLAQLLHGQTLALAALAGVFVLTAMAYFNYSSVVKITAENLTAMSGLTPTTTLLMQDIAGRLGLIPHFAVDATLIAGMAAVAIGALTMVAGARRT